ncbi:uncharacterized protein [Ptychodera flava]|uniref:uncharacterized protein n=1 Tax=Ptychodera flava TaxID=63121 RepID=UPI003969C726
MFTLYSWDYKLAFARNIIIQERQKVMGTSNWGIGGMATIIESPGEHVWGTLWEIGEEHLPALDRQEGVHRNSYRPLTVTVCSQENEVFECRTYQIIDVAEFIAPTPQYLGVILNGAKQSRLPKEYMVFLGKVEHNDYQGDSGIFDQGYKLAFSVNVRYKNQENPRWGPGGVATIVESPGDCVWGTLWEIREDDLPALDRQEGVDHNYYQSLTVNVSSPEKEVFKCRTYQMPDVAEFLEPSPQYLNVVLEGACQSGLPEEYIAFLKTIKHNDYHGNVNVLTRIHPEAYEKK